MQRIIVVGNTATGKTTLAIKLAEAYGLTYVDLDDFHLLPGWRARPPEEFRALLDNATQSDKWVLAGNYMDYSADISWPRADTLIWLDLPFLPNFWKLLKRTIKRSWTKEIIHNGNTESFFNVFCPDKSIIWWFLKLRKENSKHLTQIFSNPDQYPHLRLIRLKSYQESNCFINELLQNE